VYMALAEASALGCAAAEPGALRARATRQPRLLRPPATRRPAYGVELTDAWDTSSFKVVSGESTAAFKSIAAGESAKHTMVLRPLKEGVFTSTRANITYTTVPEDQPGDEEEPEYREALSSSDGLVQVVTSAEFRRRSGALTVEYLAVALLAAAVVVAPLLAANSASKRLSAPKRA